MTNPVGFALPAEIQRRVDLAQRYEHSIRRSGERVTSAMMSLGRWLDAFERNKLYEFAQNPDPESALYVALEADDPAECIAYGYKSLDKWFRAQANPSTSTLRLALQTYRLTRDLDVPRDLAIGVDSSKWVSLAPKLRAIREDRDRLINGINEHPGLEPAQRDRYLEMAEVAAMNDARTWVAAGQGLTKGDLKKAIGEDDGWLIETGEIEYEDVPERLRGGLDPTRPVLYSFKQAPKD